MSKVVCRVSSLVRWNLESLKGPYGLLSYHNWGLARKEPDTGPKGGNRTVLSTGVMAKPSRSMVGKWRDIQWTKLEYLTRDASHPSNQIEMWKGMAHEHFVFPCLTHMLCIHEVGLNSQFQVASKPILNSYVHIPNDDDLCSEHNDT